MAYTQNKIELIRFDTPFASVKKKQMDFIIKKLESKGWKFLVAKEAPSKKGKKNLGGAMTLHFQRQVEGNLDFDDDDDDDDDD